MELKKGIYRHFKGNEYELVGTGRHSESLEDVVVYRALYGERVLWVRPLALFMGEIERDGYKGRRFVWIRDNE